MLRLSKCGFRWLAFFLPIRRREIDLWNIFSCVLNVKIVCIIAEREIKILESLSDLSPAKFNYLGLESPFLWKILILFRRKCNLWCNENTSARRDRCIYSYRSRGRAVERLWRHFIAGIIFFFYSHASRLDILLLWFIGRDGMNSFIGCERSRLLHGAHVHVRLFLSDNSCTRILKYTI